MTTTVVSIKDKLDRIDVQFQPKGGYMHVTIDIHIEERMKLPIDLNKETLRVTEAAEFLIQSLKP